MAIYKKLILSLGVCGIMAMSALAEEAITYTEKTIKGKYTNPSGGRNDITGVSATTDLILDSTPNETANTGEMYRAKNNTVHTIKAINGDAVGDVNMASSNALDGYMTVDVNSDADITAISVASWKQNNMTLNIKNTNANASKASVTIDFGSSLTIDSTMSNQPQAVNISVAKGFVKATNTVIGNSASKSYLKIDEGANVEWEGAIVVGKPGVDRVANITANGNLTFKDGGKSNLTLYRGTSFDIGAKSVVNFVNNAFTLNKYATVNVNGRLIMGGGSYSYINGTMNINNTAPQGQMAFYWLETTGTFTQATASKNNGIRLWRKSNFKDGSDWTVDEILDLYGNVVSGASLDRTRAYAVMHEGSKMTITKASGKTAKIRLWGNSELQLYQANVFTDQNGNSIRLATAKAEYSEYGNVVRLYSEQTFSDIYITNGSNLEIYLENDLAKLILDAEGRTLVNDTAEGLKVYNFREDSIYVGTNDQTKKSIANATFYDADKNVIQVMVGNNGWLTAVSVPEPAEWAMIFGALALTLAIYRKRK